MTLGELKKLTSGNAFSPIDLVFADFILRRTRSQSPELFAAAALAGNGAVPRKVLVIAIAGLVYTALFSSVLGYKCTVNE